MEKNIIKETFKKVGLGVAILIGASAMTGCSGESTSPSIEDLREKGDFFEMQRPDGSTMVCWEYSNQGASGNAGFSWLAVTCDWNGDYEGSVSPSTTVTPTTIPTVETIG